ncbi:MAG: hypothetical protein OXE44_18165 [Nitrospinae bacterium]|nr:hypothetical protein [Nitrospinota bacterium]
MIVIPDCLGPKSVILVFLPRSTESGGHIASLHDTAYSFVPCSEERAGYLPSVAAGLIERIAPDDAAESIQTFRICNARLWTR